jgi:hypothetical protein
MRILTALLLATVFAAGCSVESTDREANTKDSFNEATLATEPQNGQTPSLPEGTRANSPLTLRISGSPGTEFSGICTANGRETVLTGEIPGKYTYRADELPISCRIQKQSSGRLKVVLRDGEGTQSIQQTSGSKGTIEISYPKG